MNRGCRRGVLTVLTAIAFVFMLRAAEGPAPAITLRPAEGRVWQTCFDPSKPLRWPWIDGSDSVRLTVRSLCNDEMTTTVIARQNDELYGVQDWPVTSDGDERLYDLTLEYLGTETVLSTESARVALVPGAAGGAFTLMDPNSVKWQKVKVEHPMFAYDADWAEEGASTISLQQSVGGAAATTRDLDGTGGYDVADTSGGSVTVLSLLYDGVEAFTGACRYVGGGLLLIFR